MRGRGVALMVGMRAGQARAEAQQAQQQQAQTAQQQAYEQGKQEAAVVQQAPAPPAPQAAPAPAPAAAPAGGEDLTAQLQSLANLHSSGVLTDEEYAAAKKKLLNL